MKKIKTPLLIIVAVALLMTVISVMPAADFYGDTTAPPLTTDPSKTYITSISGSFLSGYSWENVLVAESASTPAKIQFDKNTYSYLNLNENGTTKDEIKTYTTDSFFDTEYVKSTYESNNTYYFRYEICVNDSDYAFSDNVKVIIGDEEFHVNKMTDTSIFATSPYYYITDSDECLVNFNSTAGHIDPIKNIPKGSIVEPPAAAPVDYCVFSGWYTEPDGKGQLFDFSTTPVTESMTVYAYYPSVARDIHSATAGLALALDDSFYVGADVVNAAETRGLNLAFDMEWEEYIMTGDSELSQCVYTVDGNDYGDDQYDVGTYYFEYLITANPEHLFAEDATFTIDPGDGNPLECKVVENTGVDIIVHSPLFYLPPDSEHFIVNFVTGIDEIGVETVYPEQNATIEPPEIEKPMYNLEGWYTKPEGEGTKIDFATTPISDNMTVYANWVEKEPVAVENIDAILPNLEECFGFGIPTGNMNIGFDSEYEAILDCEPSGVCRGAYKFDGNEDVLFEDSHYDEGTYWFRYEIQAIENYYFDENTTVCILGQPCEIISIESAGKTLVVKSPYFYATKDEQHYIVNFVSGVDDVKLSPVDVVENKKVTPPDISKARDTEQYAFDGWYTEPEGKGTKINFANTPITSNMTVYANWKHYYIIFFNTLLFGEDIKQQRVYDNQKATAIKGEHPDYVFLGWYTKERNADLNDDKYDFNTPVTANKTLYAYWARYTKLYAYDISNHKINQGGTVSIGSVDNFKKNVSSTTYYNPDEDNYSDWIKAKADSGYVFREWRLISNDVEANEYTAENAPYFCSDRECIFQRTTQAYTIYAVFEKQGKHTISKIPYKEATCTKNGNNEYYYCKDCRKYYTDSAGKNETTPEKQIIYCTGKHYFEYKKVSVYPTFTQNGKDLYICKLCGEKSELSLPKYNYPNKLKVKKFKKKGFKASWNKTLGVEGYQIEYSLKKDFGGSKTILVESDSVNKWKVTGLKKKKKYYVRVRAYVDNNGNMVYSPWTPVKKVKTK